MTRIARFGLILLATGCLVRERNLLFPPAVDGLAHSPHLGTLVPSDVNDRITADAATVYGEVGPTGSIYSGGVTFDFVGTGGDVCVWLDPEFVSWTQSVSQQSGTAELSLPDNLYDDGDLDMTGGLSVYYTGERDVRTGTFRVEFTDGLGNVVPIDLTECFLEGDLQTGSETTSAHAGKGAPEFCTIANTLPNVQYTILAGTWSVPIDDRRLSFGLILANGDCQSMALDVIGADVTGDGQVRFAEECLVRGESLEPDAPQGARAAELGLSRHSWVGRDEAPTWEGVDEFEDVFCFATNTGRPDEIDSLSGYCDRERRDRLRGDLVCSDEQAPGEGLDRCFCGDVQDTPRGGAF